MKTCVQNSTNWGKKELTAMMILWTFMMSPMICLGQEAASTTATESPTKQKIPTAQMVTPRKVISDELIANRLNSIARSQDVFKSVHVTVTQGVVAVQGKVDEEAYAKSFTALCEKVDGVIGVVDQLEVLNSKKTGLRLAQSEVQTLAQKFYRFIPYLASCLVLLALTMALTLGSYRLFLKLLMRRFRRRPLIAKNFAKIFAMPVLVLGLYLILQVGGMGGLAATLVGGTGILGIILGLAGKNIIENALSSFMLSMRNSFQIGDRVTIGTETGVIQGVDSRCTTLISDDGVYTQIPNATVLTVVIKNHSIKPTHQFERERPFMYDDRNA